MTPIYENNPELGLGNCSYRYEKKHFYHKTHPFNGV